ncbi:MAG: hypothetical protein QW594_04030 [Candidatus Woesearchaeota archaeon]
MQVVFLVLEHLFPEDWLEKKVRYAFLLGFLFSLLGIFVAKMIFGASSGIVSVVFVSLLLIPSMRKLFDDEEKLEEHEKAFSLKHLYRDNKHLFEAYTGVFLGIFVAYLSATFLLPMFGYNVLNIFKEQLFLDPAISGRATFDLALFFSILENNWLVLLATFLLALLGGDGALFFIAWNASAWGSIFGYRALTASWYADANPFWYLLILLGIVIWHVLLEAAAYICAAISGAVISDDVIKESGEIKRFLGFIALALTITLFSYWVFTKLLSSSIVITFFMMILVISSLYFLGKTFTNKKHREVFIYNYWLFIIALILFLVGAFVESFVLQSSDTLATIYQQSMLFTKG